MKSVERNKKFKVAIGMNLQKGPFGGGNQFGILLSEFLTNKGIKVVYSLKDDDIDIILLTETRKWLKSCAFDPIDVLNYLKKKPDTLVVFRVNECDERKGNKLKILDKLIIKTAAISDKVVFISSWLENLFLDKAPFLKNKSVVIHNGANARIFNSVEREKWDKKTPLKIVTHHWGGNWFKGFDIYLLLDSLIRDKYKDKIRFTYIGNLPRGIRFKNSKVVTPKSGEGLAREIKKNHIYLTASMNEPAGMHHIEGALCGLPLLYRNSGALPEYCNGFGIKFNGKDYFEEKLLIMMKKYNYFCDKMNFYNQTSLVMSQNYLQLFYNLLGTKKKDRLANKEFSIFSKKLLIVTLSLLLSIKEQLIQRIHL